MVLKCIITDILKKRKKQILIFLLEFLANENEEIIPIYCRLIVETSERLTVLR
jgi:hypothetical protein